MTTDAEAERRTQWLISHALDLSGRAFKMLVILTSQADAEGQCWPGMSAMSASTGMPERSIRYSLSELRAKGIVWTAKPGCTVCQTNPYHVNFAPKAK